MTSTLAGPAAAAPAPGDDRMAAVSHLVDQSASLLRVFHALKNHVASRSAHTLLVPLSRSGPMRLTALAETVHADPSTVSRQVAELVRDDLVRREADPADGRASRLVITEAGSAVVDQLRLQRCEALSDGLSDWSAQEIHDFATAMGRFSQTLAGSLQAQPDPASTTPPSTQETR